MKLFKTAFPWQSFFPMAAILLLATGCPEKAPSAETMQSQAGQMLVAQQAQNQNAAWQAAYTCQVNFSKSQEECRKKAGTDPIAMDACSSMTNPCTPPPGGAN